MNYEKGDGKGKIGRQSNRFCRFNKKGQLVWDTLIPWVIAIGVLVLMMVLYVILQGKGAGAIEYLKNLFRFGR